MKINFNNLRRQYVNHANNLAKVINNNVNANGEIIIREIDAQELSNECNELISKVHTIASCYSEVDPEITEVDTPLPIWIEIDND